MQSIRTILAVKRAIKKRDGYKCVECGVTKKQQLAALGHDLDVHRINPGSKYTLEGGVTLCRPCHMKKPRSPNGSRHKGPTTTIILNADQNMWIGIIAAQWGVRKLDVVKFIVEKHTKSLYDEVVADMIARGDRLAESCAELC